MLYVGIDQHRKQLTVSVRDESGCHPLLECPIGGDSVRARCLAGLRAAHRGSRFDGGSGR
jgi:hypothetical protein